LFIVPAYNEGNTIGSVIADLQSIVPANQILIVNDGSEDHTLRSIREFDVHCIDFPVNLGVSSVLQAGFCFALRHGFSAAIQFDGDGQHLAEQAQCIAQPVTSGQCDIAIGVRDTQKDGSTSLPRQVGGKVLSGFLKVFTGQRFVDPTSGFRAYSDKAIRKFALEFPDEYPEIESIVLAKKYGLTLLEKTVQMRQRQGGRSSITFLGSWYYMFKVILASAVMMLRKY
jgi:glycosyltransferase involved in cell wall biosynthesis